jgi:birA, biotin-[acetyl-CoA-carboxylase] ligase region
MHSPGLWAEQLRDAMCGCVIGNEIHVLLTTTSTNDAIVERISAEAPQGLTIFAEMQTAGRGQRGRPWESAPGKGLWFSVLLRPQIALADSALLTAWAAAAVCDTLLPLGIHAIVKSPNDVVVGTQKIAGVLVEMRAQPSASHVAVLGIGLNVNQSQEDFSTAIGERATSIACVLGREVERTALAIALLRRLNDSYTW